MKWTVRLMVLAALVGVVAGCSKPPTMEMDAAKQKLEQARSAQADQYAPADWQAAQDAMNAADQEIAAQNAKMALMRNYKQAKTLVTAADEAAGKAQTAAAEGKERMRGEAETLITQATAAIDSASALMKKAPKGKETKADLDLIQGDITAAQSSLEEAKMAMTQTDYIQAKAKAQAVLDKANQVSGEITAAIEKVRGHRRK
jgi:hypothetical protein